MKKFLLSLFLLIAVNAHAAGVNGLNYTTYAPNGSLSSPNQNTLTQLSTGTVPNLNYNWSYVLNSGRADAVVVKFTGYFKADTTGTYTFGITADDGVQLIMDNQYIINYWGDQGPTLRSGSINLTAGQIVPVTVWYYENGGGATLQWYQLINNSWQIVPTGSLATDATFWAPPAPVLCCGGSSAAFTMTNTHQQKVNQFTSRTTADSKVNIEQIGDSNTVLVQSY